MKENHPSNEENVLDERRQNRILSNRLAARKASTKKKSNRVQLINQVQTLRKELAEIKKQEAPYQYEEDLYKMKMKSMSNKIGALQQQELIRNAKDAILDNEEKRLKELRIAQQKQLLNRNIAMLWPAMSDNNPMPNFYPVSGNGVGTYSYMPPDPSQLWIAPVENMQELNLTPPTNMAFMDQSNLVWGSGFAPYPPNFNN